MHPKLATSAASFSIPKCSGELPSRNCMVSANRQKCPGWLLVTGWSTSHLSGADEHSLVQKFYQLNRQ
jgi:hypothetical protein